MFRINALPQTDPAEERRRVRAAVNHSIASFVFLCTAIRMAPLVLKQLQISY